jgi:DNA-binding MarR family transcriptional regulator
VDSRKVRSPGAAFLIAQVGGLSSRLWVERLAKVGLDAREVMLFRHVALNAGRSQRLVAEAIGLPPSRIVGLVDRLEQRGWLERRASSTDRRRNALYLTPAGRKAIEEIATVSSEHEAELTRSLDPDDRAELIRILGRVAEDHGLIEGVHPGFADPRADLTTDGEADPAKR